MTNYEIVFENLKERVLNGTLSIEEAEVLNDIAYEKYVVETSKESKAKRDELYYGERIRKGESKIPDDFIELHKMNLRRKDKAKRIFDEYKYDAGNEKSLRKSNAGKQNSYIYTDKYPASNSKYANKKKEIISSRTGKTDNTVNSYNIPEKKKIVSTKNSDQKNSGYFKIRKSDTKKANETVQKSKVSMFA